jgi:hypothetical protein
MPTITIEMVSSWFTSLPHLRPPAHRTPPSTGGAPIFSNIDPSATPYSPSLPSGIAVEELPEWLLFSTSSSKGQSDCPSSLSPVASFIDVICRSGSGVSLEAGPSSTPCQCCGSAQQVACSKGKGPRGRPISACAR